MSIKQPNLPSSEIRKSNLTKASKRKETINIKVGISEIENRENQQKQNLAH